VVIGVGNLSLLLYGLWMNEPLCGHALCVCSVCVCRCVYLVSFQCVGVCGMVLIRGSYCIANVVPACMQAPVVNSNVNVERLHCR
jgi:hypothetical protein